MIREAWRSRRSSVIFMAAVLVIAGLLAVKVIFFPEQSRESAAPSASASASPSLSAVAASAGSVGADGRAVCDVKVPAGKEFSAEVPDDYTLNTPPGAPEGFNRWVPPAACGVVQPGTLWGGVSPPVLVGCSGLLLLGGGFVGLLLLA